MDEDEPLNFLRPETHHQQQKSQRTAEEEIQRKKEIQKRKNEKLKWKKKNRPDFQYKIRRPIYGEYNYHQIRAQLAEDNIHTSHDIKMNNEKTMVSI